MKLLAAAVLAASMAFAASLPHPAPDIGAGRAAYDSADFKKAARCFEAAFRANPGDPEASFWLGKSYEVLTDVSAPFYSSHRWAKARFFLERAVELAPARRDYRREYFDFLLESADHSRGALSEAERFLKSLPESDSDSADMAARLHEERAARGVAAVRVAAFLRLVPQQADRIAELPWPSFHGPMHRGQVLTLATPPSALPGGE